MAPTIVYSASERLALPIALLWGGTACVSGERVEGKRER
jgi:hypothetical protein